MGNPAVLSPVMLAATVVVGWLGRTLTHVWVRRKESNV